jgi:hypothetical protein
VLPIDIMVVLISFMSITKLLLNRGFIEYFKKIFVSPWKYLIVFLLISLASLLYNFSTYPVKDGLVALAYWIRFTLIFFALSSLEIKKIKDLKSLFIIWSSAILLMGFVQYLIVPDFSFMTVFGWDPHQGRMLSTFYDPNYFGAFLTLVMGMLISSVLGNQKTKWPILLFVLCWIGLYLTFSRSAWLIGAIAIPLTAWPKSWKIAILLFGVFVLIILMPNRLSSRVSQSSSFLSSLFNKTTVLSGTSTEDPSAASRGVSIRRAWELGKKNWIIGVGYNAYAPALVRDEIVGESLSGLSSQGSDSSILNVFATTGVPGLFTFLIFLISLSLFSHKDWKKGSPNGFLFGYLIAVFIGSFFNNLLFYTLIIIPFYLFIFGLKAEENAQ